MIKHWGKQALGEAKFRYVSALSDPQVRAMLKQGKLQLELFEDEPAEVEMEGKRYILRCNPQTQSRERARREWRRVPPPGENERAEPTNGSGCMPRSAPAMRRSRRTNAVSPRVHCERLSRCSRSIGSMDGLKCGSKGEKWCGPKMRARERCKGS